MSRREGETEKREREREKELEGGTESDRERQRDGGEASQRERENSETRWLAHPYRDVFDLRAWYVLVDHTSGNGQGSDFRPPAYRSEKLSSLAATSWAHNGLPHKWARLLLICGSLVK